MFFQIELLYFLVMIAVFIVMLLVVKAPSGISMMVSALVGGILFCIISGEQFSLRYYVDGAFGYFDTILIITAAMIFMGGLQACGALDYLSALLVKKLHKYPTLLLLSFMLIIMFPGMVTGSSLSSIVSSGALLAPIMVKMGIPKAKAGAIVAFGAILGMIAPPINVPVMAICDVADIPFQGFTLPLLALTIPPAIFAVLFLGRKYVKEINLDEMAEVIDFSILDKKPKVQEKVRETEEVKEEKEFDDVDIDSLIEKKKSKEEPKEEKKEPVSLDWTCLIGLFLLIILIILESVLPRIFGSLGMTLIFIIATIPTFFTGRKVKPHMVVKDGVYKSFGAMALLAGVGMFVEVLTWIGARGWFVANALSLPSLLQYVAIAITLPVFGGISAFGSASILGGPFVMAFLALDNIIVASALSLLAGLGEFLPPTAMSATFAGQSVGEEKYIKITKAALIPFFVTLVYAMLFIIVVARIWSVA